MYSHDNLKLLVSTSKLWSELSSDYDMTSRENISAVSSLLGLDKYNMTVDNLILYITYHCRVISKVSISAYMPEGINLQYCYIRINKLVKDGYLDKKKLSKIPKNRKEYLTVTYYSLTTKGVQHITGMFSTKVMTKVYKRPSDRSLLHTYSCGITVLQLMITRTILSIEYEKAYNFDGNEDGAKLSHGFAPDALIKLTTAPPVDNLPEIEELELFRTAFGEVINASLFDGESIPQCTNADDNEVLSLYVEQDCFTETTRYLYDKLYSYKQACLLDGLNVTDSILLISLKHGPDVFDYGRKEKFFSASKGKTAANVCSFLERSGDINSSVVGDYFTTVLDLLKEDLPLPEGISYEDADTFVEYYKNIFSYLSARLNREFVMSIYDLKRFIRGVKNLSDPYMLDMYINTEYTHAYKRYHDLCNQVNQELTYFLKNHTGSSLSEPVAFLLEGMQVFCTASSCMFLYAKYLTNSKERLLMDTLSLFRKPAYSGSHSYKAVWKIDLSRSPLKGINATLRNTFTFSRGNVSIEFVCFDLGAYARVAAAAYLCNKNLNHLIISVVDTREDALRLASQYPAICKEGAPNDASGLCFAFIKLSDISKDNSLFTVSKADINTFRRKR